LKRGGGEDTPFEPDRAVIAPDAMLVISDAVSIPDSELVFTALRAQGAGGQNVNKVSTAVQLRFDISGSPSLPDACRQRLLARSDQRITADGVIVIKSQETRSQARNKEIALERLAELIESALTKPKRRIRTKPSKAARQKRLGDKSHRSRLKKGRSRIED
jgi:ribosome-associated protein